MTDEQRQNLADLARRFNRTEAAFVEVETAYEDATDRLREAQRLLVSAMAAASLTHIVVDGRLLWRDQETIDSPDDQFAAIP